MPDESGNPIPGGPQTYAHICSMYSPILATLLLVLLQCCYGASFGGFHPYVQVRAESFINQGGDDICLRRTRGQRLLIMTIIRDINMNSDTVQMNAYFIDGGHT